MFNLINTCVNFYSIEQNYSKSIMTEFNASGRKWNGRMVDTIY